MAKNQTKDLEEVIAQEKAYIKQRRLAAFQQLEEAVNRRFQSNSKCLSPKIQKILASDDNTIGLALSGGGMRSATFNLGVLQGLHKIGFLPWVDYLSTVSGGGYLGCCLSSLLSMRYLILPVGTQVWHTLDKGRILTDSTGQELDGEAWLYISYRPRDEIGGLGAVETGWINTKDSAGIEQSGGSSKSCEVRTQLGNETDIKKLAYGFELGLIINHWVKIHYKETPETKNFKKGWIPYKPNTNGKASFFLPAGTEVRHDFHELHTLTTLTEVEVIGEEWLYISYQPRDEADKPGAVETGWITTEDSTGIEQSGGTQQAYYVWTQPEAETDVRYLAHGFKLESIINRCFKIRYKKIPDAENLDEGWVQLSYVDKPKYKFNLYDKFPFTDGWPIFDPKTTQANPVGRNHQLYHMRLNSNFIIPRRGLLKLDTLRSIGTVFTGISHTLAIFVPIFFIIAGLHYVLAGILSSEIGQKINFVSAPTTTQPFNSAEHTISQDQFWYVLFFSEAPATLSSGGESSASLALPTPYLWFFGTGLLLPFFLFFYLNHAYKSLKPNEKSENNISAQERFTIELLRTSLLGLVVAFVALTFFLRIWIDSAQTFRLYWLWQPAVFMGGVWLTSTFVYMLYAQHRLWSTDFRSLITAWQGNIFYGLWASLLFALLALPYYITIPNAQGKSSNVSILLVTSLLSTFGSYLLANNLAKTGSTGWLKKFFSRLEGLQQGLLGTLVIILIVSCILLFATLFDSIPQASSKLAEYGRPWLVLLFNVTVFSLMLYISVWWWSVRSRLNYTNRLFASLLLLVGVFILILGFSGSDKNILLVVATVGGLLIVALLLLPRFFVDWTTLEAWLLQTFTIFAILNIFSLILWLFTGGIYLIPLNLLSTLILILSGLIGLGLLFWFFYKLFITWQGSIPVINPNISSAQEGVRAVAVGSLILVVLTGLILYWNITPNNDPRWLTVLLVTIWTIGLFVLINSFTNLNQISLHYFYRDRLAAAFLKTNVYDNRLGRITQVRDQGEVKVQEINPPHCSAPYHLIVSALNLSGSKSLTYKDSKSEPFIFSRYFCGSRITGYSETNIYRGGNTKLARALAISGAALSSNLGQYTYFAQAFVMTMLNLRLGYWTDNPGEYDPEKMCDQKGINQLFKLNRNAPFTLEPSAFWAQYLWYELSGTANNSGKKLINLSDGGHTDNLGLYPLLLRRCKLIIVSDAGGDPEYLFDDITRLIRRVNIEENIRIDINLEGLRPNPLVNGFSPHHCAVGKITYPPNQDKTSEETGWLIYFKPSITAIEDGAVKAYWWTHQDSYFPHQTTLDQFYNDDQFETYRQLGELTISNTLTACRTFYKQHQEDFKNNKPQAIHAAFKKITDLFGRTDEQRRNLKKAQIMCSILENPDKSLFTELSEDLLLEDVVKDLKSITTI